MLQRSPWAARASAGTLPAKSLDARRVDECDRPRAYTVADLQAAARAVADAIADRARKDEY